MMNTNEKKIFYSVLATVALAIAVGATQCGAILDQPVSSQSPGPSPSVTLSPEPKPSESPTPSVSPKPTITPSSVPVSSSPSPVVSTVRYAMRGEILGWIVRNPKTTELPLGAKIFEVQSVSTLIPSFKGAQLGQYEDPLIPTTVISPDKSYWVDYTASVSGSYKILGETVTVKVINRDFKPVLDAYMELESVKMIQAYGIQDNVQYQGPMLQKHIALYREHLFEPIKQHVDDISLTNIDKYKEYQASFRQTTLTGFLYPPFLARWYRGAPLTAADQAAAENLVKNGLAPIGSMIYLWDEEQAIDASRKLVIERNAEYAKTMPSVRQFLTWKNDAAITKPDQVELNPVYNLRSNERGVYPSCMSNGNCGPQTITSVAPATGHPMLVLDAPAIHARAATAVAYATGARRFLYFNGTKKLGPDQLTKPGAMYSEGGNGDGTTVYVCPDKLGPCPSLRLKRMRLGLADAAWAAIGAKLPVISAVEWSKNEADYDAARKQIAESL